MRGADRRWFDYGWIGIEASKHLSQPIRTFAIQAHLISISQSKSTISPILRDPEAPLDGETRRNRIWEARHLGTPVTHGHRDRDLDPALFFFVSYQPGAHTHLEGHLNRLDFLNMKFVLFYSRSLDATREVSHDGCRLRGIFGVVGGVRGGMTCSQGEGCGS